MLRGVDEPNDSPKQNLSPTRVKLQKYAWMWEDEEQARNSWEPTYADASRTP